MLTTGRYGLYVVQFLNETAPPIPKEESIRPQDHHDFVDRWCCKAGKVQGGFDIRYHEYCDAYGKDNIVFTPVVVFDSKEALQAAEKAMKQFYKDSRKRSHKGGLTEYIDMRELDLVELFRFMRNLKNGTDYS